MIDRILRATVGLLVVMIIAVGCGEEADQQRCEIGVLEGGSTGVVCPDGSEFAVDDGADGEDGIDGEDGTSCEVDEGPDGEALITCEDGTEGTVQDGDDGEDGEPGQACWSEDNDDGSYDLHCEDGSSVTVTDGEDGADGADGEDGLDCQLEEDDGQFTLSCDDGTELSLGDGDGGDSSCTIDDNGDGTATVDCGDGPALSFQLVSDDAQVEIFVAFGDVNDDDEVNFGAIIRNEGQIDYDSSLTIEYFEQDSEPVDSDDGIASDTISDGIEAGGSYHSHASYTTDDDASELWAALIDDDDEFVDTFGPFDYTIPFDF